MLPKLKPSPYQIYLDYAATTYLDPRVEKAMQPFWRRQFGNPSSLYKQGKQGSNAIAQARKQIAEILNCRPTEIIFTAGGTESVNLAIFGAARQHELTAKQKGHLIASRIEHHAVLHSLEALKQEGWAVSLIDVDNRGFIKFDDLKKAVRPDTVLISVMYANNEIGTIEPISQIGKWLGQLNRSRRQKNLPEILFHTDACQAAGSLSLEVDKLGVDLLSANGSKIYGPKQAGFLYARTGVKLRPLIYGGGQEKNLRSGTENVPGIVGLAHALQLVQKTRVKENQRLRGLRDYFLDQLIKKIPGIVLNGPAERGLSIIDNQNNRGQKKNIKAKPGKKTGFPQRLPNNVNISIVGAEGEALLLYLDSYNVAVSTGSACTSTSPDPSHVILALGQPANHAQSSMRFSFGQQTTKKDLDYVLKILPGLVEELRRLNSKNEFI